MEKINYIDRVSGKVCQEKVYGYQFLKFLYGDDWISRLLSPTLLFCIARFPFFSALYGWWQRLPITKKKIEPFIKNFDVDASEFLKKPSDFHSFNDFFIRKLKPEARPIVQGEDFAVIPADGRYYFFQDISKVDGFLVKNQKFSLGTLLQDQPLAEEYAKGTMVIARLCPADYHRFHFCCSCVPGKTKLIPGWLYSVNPIAVKKNINIFTENKRTICELQSEKFGKVLFLEVGATNVGSIHQTYMPHHHYQSGDEKGFFSFGGSTLVILFPPNRLQLDNDLLAASRSGVEIKCLMGQSMGKKIVNFLF